MRFRGQNPVYSRAQYSDSSEYSATYGGVVLKSGFLLSIIAVIALYFGSILDFSVNPVGMIFTVILSPIVAIIMLVLAHRNIALAGVFSFIYAICEGVFLGFISSIFAQIAGMDIVYNALIATFGVLSGMLILYSTGIIRVESRFRSFMFSAVLGIVFVSLLMFGMFIFGGADTQVFNSLYITIVLVSVVVSSLYLLVDFGNITQIVSAGAGKEYEWSLALGLVVTIVWLYIELLRLMLIISGRRK